MIGMATVRQLVYIVLLTFLYAEYSRDGVPTLGRDSIPWMPPKHREILPWVELILDCIGKRIDASFALNESEFKNISTWLRTSSNFDLATFGRVMHQYRDNFQTVWSFYSGETGFVDDQQLKTVLMRWEQSDRNLLRGIDVSLLLSEIKTHVSQPDQVYHRHEYYDLHRWIREKVEGEHGDELKRVTETDMRTFNVNTFIQHKLPYEISTTPSNHDRQYRVNIVQVDRKGSSDYDDFYQQQSRGMTGQSSLEFENDGDDAGVSEEGSYHFLEPPDPGMSSFRHARTRTMSTDVFDYTAGSGSDPEWNPYAARGHCEAFGRFFRKSFVSERAGKSRALLWDQAKVYRDTSVVPAARRLKAKNVPGFLKTLVDVWRSNERPSIRETGSQKLVNQINMAFVDAFTMGGLDGDCGFTEKEFWSLFREALADLAGE